MKKPMNILVTVTCVFAAFLGGFHIGRSLNRAPIQIYQLPDPTVEDALPAEKTEAAAPWCAASPSGLRRVELRFAAAARRACSFR